MFMIRLGAWRTSDIESYQSAYVSLVLHRFWAYFFKLLVHKSLLFNRIFSPIVRHHQLFWSPFTSTVAISEQPWFSQVQNHSTWKYFDLISDGFQMFQLAPYCLGPKETLDEFSEDPDRLLLSSIAEKVLNIYLPFVSDQTWLKVMVAKLVTIVRASYDPVSTNQTQRLVGCIQRTLQDFPSITPRLRSHCWFSCHLSLHDFIS